MNHVTDDAPIFVVGNARSGTTIMRLMLSAHPRIYICHELTFYTWESLFPAGRNGSAFLAHYLRTKSFKRLRLDPAAVTASLPEQLARRDVGLALRQIMRLKAASLGRVRYGDKTPLNVGHLDRIYADFPNARVVVMARDPRTNVPSLSLRPFGSSSDLANCITYVGARRNAWPFRDRALIVRLEDLQREPRSVMGAVLDFVGEEWSEDVLDHVNNRVDPLDVPALDWYAHSLTPLERPTDDLSTLSPERVRLIESMTHKSMQELGYARLEMASPPSRARTALRIMSEVPEALRFWWTITRIVRRLRDPSRWGVDDARLNALVRRVNPKASHSDVIL